MHVLWIVVWQTASNSLKFVYRLHKICKETWWHFEFEVPSVRNELWSLWPTKHYFDVKSVAYSNRNQSGFITRKLNVFPELEPPLSNRWQGSQYMCVFCYLIHIQEFYISLFCKEQSEINQGKQTNKQTDILNFMIANFYHETLSVI